MVKQFFIFILIIWCAFSKAQDTTITFTKEEFSEFKFIKQALIGLPASCKIVSYELTAFMVNGVKTINYNSKEKDTYTPLFMQHIAQYGGEMKVSKLKTSCPATSHKTKYKIIVK